MSMSKLPELQSFFSTYFSESEAAQDAETTLGFVRAADSGELAKVLNQAQGLLLQKEVIVEAIGMNANRWFEEVDEAQEWLERVIEAIEGAESGESAGDANITKDSNGTPLSEGDAVTVIKDLKVKGGNSDLKRGTVIRKIHLIGDPDNVECRVDGSTLVLKTMYLKKA